MAGLDDTLALIEARRDEQLETLFRLLRQPSISAQDVGVRECAELVRELMAANGIDARLIETGGQPVVYGEAGPADGAGPTVLVYGHYDVQPPEPLDEWHSPPFEPTVREGRVYARGAGDNKGQFLAHILAAGALRDTGGLPVRLKFLVEGEEEIGSVNLHRFVESERGLLAADLAYSSDGPMHADGRPVVFYGLRGLLYIELRARGANRDLHSGNYGGTVPNPAWTLVQLLATMRDPRGRVLIDGYYDAVRPPTPFEEELLARIPYDADAYAQELDLRPEDRLDAATFHRRLMFEPTCNIAGFVSGYGGPGSKTVIPHEATVKMDFRLVADQDPEEIWERVRRHVERHAPGVELLRHGSTPPSKTSPELPECRAVARAVAAARGVEPVILPSLGGSGPDYLFTRVLGLPSVWVPYAPWDERNHAPNESIGVEDFIAGIKTSATVFAHLAHASEGGGQ
jgi:acetylornithine deacetylase/succinyl-diaminopimelate desuccinylase-like protein